VSPLSPLLAAGWGEIGPRWQAPRAQCLHQTPRPSTRAQSPWQCPLASSLIRFCIFSHAGSVHVDLSLSMSVTKLRHSMPDLVPEPPVPPGHGQAGDAHGHPAVLPRNVVVAMLLQPISGTKGCPPKTRTGSSGSTAESSSPVHPEQSHQPVPWLQT